MNAKSFARMHRHSKDFSRRLGLSGIKRRLKSRSPSEDRTLSLELFMLQTNI
jgi:hypothetical protein